MQRKELGVMANQTLELECHWMISHFYHTDFGQFPPTAPWESQTRLLHPSARALANRTSTKIGILTCPNQLANELINLITPQGLDVSKTFDLCHSQCSRSGSIKRSEPCFCQAWLVKDWVACKCQQSTGIDSMDWFTMNANNSTQAYYNNIV